MKINTKPALFISVLFALLLSLLLGRFFYTLETQVIHSDFEKDVITETLALKQELALNLHALHALKNFFDNSQQVEPQQFNQFTTTLLNLYPNITTLSWAPKIALSERQLYNQRNYFGHTLKITQRNQAENLITASERMVYFPISYIEPLQNNLNTLGFDLSSHAKYSTALTSAKETGRITLTPTIYFSHSDSQQKGILATIPVYDKTSHEISGYLNAVFHTGKLIDTALKNTIEHDISLKLFDVTSDQKQLIHIAHPIPDLSQTMHMDYPLGNISGRKWLIEAIPSENYISQKRTKDPILIFLLVFFFLTISIHYIHDLQKQSQITEQAVKERTVELNEIKNTLERISLIDEMTGIANRRHFDSFMQDEWERGLREQTPLTMIIIDIDFFKQFNDNYGHLAGDTCIQQVATGLNSTVRRLTDLLARYGGEEFAIIAPNTPDGFILSELCREHIISLNIPHNHSKITDHITVSVGFATLIPSNTSNPDELFKMADQALYKAKSSGRNKSTAF